MHSSLATIYFLILEVKWAITKLTNNISSEAKYKNKHDKDTLIKTVNIYLSICKDINIEENNWDAERTLKHQSHYDLSQFLSFFKSVNDSHY